ncbi:N-alpha-acetyltransferase RimI [Lactobacillus helveticus]|uniref:ribosomal protein S18-alanine N-acetyltransferase n=3 Tax=Lactobacillus helveticus TaxID=1587 RepID=UPI00156297B2|nr:ribosomal protein S18-alanine N-acetyltransferase [Lactobacillus helveticus]NRN93139.1 N-alpha-acetyltransferase RimI [Lactobacillus helveticus]NRO05686.1 N-alpha-acetyltransferase RimI [Lactobacillus helveticus]NRO21781.1 N-alpha-acetyltransferase RimI [Lactobacillus helveticus]NRO25779.1 N-alpha-acetyltransferase RimI [Lactobacillus helveticus]NRO30207.1 N-alpha-acetyltransferase RimI [Lactobacillus helveticus]
MLKKFNQFFHQSVNQIDMSFTPFILVINGKILQVMQANDDNIPDLLVLEQQVYSGRTPWSQFSFATELRKRNNSLYLVVYHASNLVAFIGARFSPEETHITNIAVSPLYQHQHIGHYLMEMMINSARDKGSDCVTLEVRTDNEIAQRLYRSLGFTGNFIRKNYYQDTHTDAINMVLWLSHIKLEKRSLRFE